MKRARTIDIRNKVFSYLINSEPYELFDITKIRRNTGIRTDLSVSLAIYKLDMDGSLDPYIVKRNLGGRLIYVRKQKKVLNINR